jgi:hypothetical protein
MALHVPKAPGFQSMLKDGARVNKKKIFKLLSLLKLKIFFF